MENPLTVGRIHSQLMDFLFTIKTIIMITRNVKFWFVMVSGLVFITMAGKSQEYQKSASGIQYKFHKTVKNAAKPVAGDLLTLSMVYRTSADSLVFDSRRNGYEFTYTLANSSFTADFNHALLMMGKGDSASFILKADSFYLKTLGMKKLPSFVKKTTNLNFHVKLLAIKAANDVLQEQVNYMKDRTSKNDVSKKTEKDSISKYLERNKITEKPTQSGLYFISLQEGNGIQPKVGNKVKVNYKGMFTNGKTFDSSYDAGAPFEFKTGAKQVIRGFEEGILMMKKGGKAKLIIPSSIGYGENSAGEIPPFTTLIFEIELLDIN